MDLEFTQRAELRTAPRIVPEQIFSARVLQMPAQELEAFLRAEFQENPALLMEEAEPAPDEPQPAEDDWEPSVLGDEEPDDPFRAVARPPTLAESLASQYRILHPPEDWPVGLDVIESLDPDGYFREDMLDAADRHSLSVPEFEAYLTRVQALDPPGIAARDLRECLLLQAGRHPETPPLVPRLLAEDVWPLFAQRDTERIATQLGEPPERLEAAMDWVRANFRPYPAEAERPDFETLAPRTRPRVQPDVILRLHEGEIRVECPGLARIRLGVDGWYSQLYDRVRRLRGVSLPPDARHVVDHVDRARLVARAVDMRGQTLHRIASQVVDVQRALVLRGPRFARPYTQKEVAAAVGLHESTICRAVQGKMVQLPDGETVPFDYFFDAALPARELVAEIIGREDRARPLNDAQVAEEMARHGVKVARRTVAKYRDQMHILPRELRRNAPPGGNIL